MDSQPIQPHNPQTPLKGEVLPFAAKQITLSQQEYIELKHGVNYWQAQHKKACEREESLKQELQQKEAIIRDLKQRLFGKKSEKGICKADQNPDQDCKPESQHPKRSRGHQQGRPGHGRTERPHLPVVEEVIELDGNSCPQCGQAYLPFPGEEESEIIEIEVRAYKRLIKRKRCKKGCHCASTPSIISAPVPAKIIPRSPYSLSVWEQVLLGKFLYGQPVNRILQDLSSHGLTIAQGTITGGLEKLKPLFEPVYQGIYEQQMTENTFHNDESRWEVYENVEGKEGHRWYLWVMQSKTTVYFCIDPTRSADVVLRHYSALESDLAIVVCDRYSAYKKLARLNLAIVLAFCWAHVRRDFLELARSHPDLKGWGLAWVEEIGTLYHLNKERLERWELNVPLAEQSSDFQVRHKALDERLIQMKSRCDAILQADSIAQTQQESTSGQLDVAQRKVLTSLQNHWAGLTVFLDHPEIPMDNNSAERTIRGPVVGRKNYYGSGSIWSATLAAMMFSIFQTMTLWKLNPRTWLRLYLECCAQNAGQAPDDLSDFLPWKMSPARSQQLSQPPKPTPSPNTS